jgi:ribosomal-protein-alanine N-acetyltransferase
MSSAEPWLRAVAADDLDALAEIHAQAFDPPWPAQALRATLDGPHVTGLIAGAGAHAAGFILLSSVAGEAEILTLAVRPADRRRGVAALLVEAAAGVALTQASEVLWLEVAEDNPAAIALYGRAGFILAGRRPRYYPRPGAASVDALLMRRPLNSGPA